MDQHGVNQTIEYLEKNKNYPYVEDIACETAAAFANSKEFETSNVYHQKMVETQTQIKGEMIVRNNEEKSKLHIEVCFFAILY